MITQSFTPFCWKHRWTMVKDVQRFGWQCPIPGCENFATREAVHRFGWDWERARDHRPCCPSCRGTGISGDIETNGRCWDCRGSGHPHDPLQPFSIAVIRNH